MERESKSHTGNLCLLCPLVPKLGELYESPGCENVFIARWCVAIPREVPAVDGSNKYPMNGVHDVGELMATEIDIRRENHLVVLVYVLEYT